MGYLDQIRRDIEYELFIFATKIMARNIYDTQTPLTLKGPCLCDCLTLA